MSEAATAEKLEEPVEAEDKTAKVSPATVGRFEEEAQANIRWRMNVPIGITPEDCMDEAYWTHIGIRLTPGDEIRVLPDDMRWELLLQVIDAGRSFAHVQKKQFYQYDAKGSRPKIASNYKVEFAGTTKKHRVLRDGEELKDGFATESLAQRWLTNHIAAIDR